MSSATEVFLPPSFPYPIKITSIDAATDVKRGTRLFSYSFVHIVQDEHHEEPQPETRFGTWDSSIEGTVEKWNAQAGDVISRRRATEKPVVLILEPCKHGMQLGGLCVVCGKDMTKWA
jgi:RNA polymerase II subunit A C-terminal domain phosphatase